MRENEDPDVRLALLRTMRPAAAGAPDKDGVTEEDHCYRLIIEALLQYSRGSGNENVYPYTKQAIHCVESFKSIPTPWFANTLAAIYPFVATEKEAWPARLKQCSHPMTHLWPTRVMKRHLHFLETFRERRDAIFSGYENAGGTYEDIIPPPKESEAESETEDEVQDTNAPDFDDVF